MRIWVLAVVLGLGVVRGGAQMAFDVASVRQNVSVGGERESNVPMGPGDVYTPTGGELNAKNFPLMTLIAFAYRMNDGQLATFKAAAPGWVLTDRFNVQARTENRNVTKDELRLMMRSLLAERFKMAIHVETRQVAVYGLTLVKAGVMGPKLREHPAGETCSKDYAPKTADGTPAPELPETVVGGFPTVCGGVLGIPASAGDRFALGARDIPIRLLLSSLSSWGNLGRPVVDHTGLNGKYDFVLEFTPEQLANGAGGGVDSGGPTFREAMKKQLGLQLEAQTGTVEVLVLDHLEHLTEN